MPCIGCIHASVAEKLSEVVTFRLSPSAGARLDGLAKEAARLEGRPTPSRNDHARSMVMLSLERREPRTKLAIVECIERFRRIVANEAEPLDQITELIIGRARRSTVESLNLIIDVIQSDGYLDTRDSSKLLEGLGSKLDEIQSKKGETT